MSNTQTGHVAISGETEAEEQPFDSGPVEEAIGTASGVLGQLLDDEEEGEGGAGCR
jgi:hypothetical protein